MKNGEKIMEKLTQEEREARKTTALELGEKKSTTQRLEDFHEELKEFKTRVIVGIVAPWLTVPFLLFSGYSWGLANLPEFVPILITAISVVFFLVTGRPVEKQKLRQIIDGVEKTIGWSEVRK